jgi:hypothetical protein
MHSYKNGHASFEDARKPTVNIRLLLRQNNRKLTSIVDTSGVRSSLIGISRILEIAKGSIVAKDSEKTLKLGESAP